MALFIQTIRQCGFSMTRFAASATELIAGGGSAAALGDASTAPSVPALACGLANRLGRSQQLLVGFVNSRSLIAILVLSITPMLGRSTRLRYPLAEIYNRSI